MKIIYINNAVILLILYLNLFDYVLNKENNKVLNNTEIKNEKASKYNKKKLVLLIIKTLSICLAIILIYTIISIITKTLCLKKEVYKYLNKKLVKKGFLDEKDISFVIHNLNISFFFKFIESELMNACKYKNKSLYTNYEMGCSICLQDFQPESKVIITSCGHIYHYKCMKDFLNLIEKEMIQKKHEKNERNFLNYFNCPNCKNNILKQLKINNIKDEKYIAEEIKVQNIYIINNKLNNNDITSPVPTKIKETKTSSNLSLSSSLNLKSKSFKTKKRYYKKNKIFKKKNYHKKFVNNNIINNDKIGRDNINNKIKKEELNIINNNVIEKEKKKEIKK